ncbi:MAG: transposase [Deltaproteobacteria bacterium]|nr:transposase [Deltaproteobacteria bacterium]
MDLLKEIKELWNVNIAAYCLMTNHYHILLQTPDANLSRVMRHLNSIYTQRFNKAHSFDGSLFRPAVTKR